MIQQMVQQAVQQAMAQQGGGAGGGGGGAGGIKPKIDINVEIMKMNKMLAKMMDAMGIQMPVADMVATEQDLGQLAAGGDPGTAAAAPEGAAPGGAGGLAPMEAMQPMAAAKTATDQYVPSGEAQTSPLNRQTSVMNRANAILRMRQVNAQQ